VASIPINTGSGATVAGNGSGRRRRPVDVFPWMGLPVLRYRRPTSHKLSLGTEEELLKNGRSGGQHEWLGQAPSFSSEQMGALDLGTAGGDLRAHQTLEGSVNGVQRPNTSFKEMFSTNP